MVSSIRNIGNSKGVILPKGFLTACDIGEQVNIEVREGSIVITPATQRVKRAGWEQAFKEMAQNGDDAPLMPDFFEDETNEDWTWR